MGHRNWLERVANELAGQGLPAGARARLVAELRDHLEDLTDGGAEMASELEVEARMGAPAEVAAAAGRARAGWVRRHPLVVFGLGPVPAAVACVALYAAGLVALGVAARAAGLAADSTARAAAGVLVAGAAFVPFALAALAFARLGVRAGVGRGWALAALAQIALVAGFATVSLTWSDLPGRSQLAVGLRAPAVEGRQWAQLAVPLVLGCAAVGAFRRRVAAA